MFWDSGNHGSSTLGVNVTNYDESTQVNGNRSVKLSSQFVGILGIGKFAAGNLFAGEYVDTDGYLMVFWILDARVPDRPATLTGYYKYNQGTIDYVGSGTPRRNYIRNSGYRMYIYCYWRLGYSSSYQD